MLWLLGIKSPRCAEWQMAAWPSHGDNEKQKYLGNVFI